MSIGHLQSDLERNFPLAGHEKMGFDRGASNELDGSGATSGEETASRKYFRRICTPVWCATRASWCPDPADRARPAVARNLARRRLSPHRPRLTNGERPSSRSVADQCTAASPATGMLEEPRCRAPAIR